MKSNRFLGKDYYKFIFLLLTLLFSSFNTEIMAKASGTGNFPPPASGTWDIYNDTIVQDEIITINGTVEVHPGATLELINCTIVMNASTTNSTYFLVDNGANLTIDSTIISSNNYNWYIAALKGSSLLIQNSALTGIDEPNVQTMSTIIIYSDNAKIINNTILSTDFYAVDIKGANFVEVMNNELVNCYGGINIEDSQNITVKTNNFYNTAIETVVVRKSNYTLITDNYGVNSYSGIYIDSSYHLTVDSNRFENTYSDAVDIYYSHYINVINLNVFNSSISHGISIYGASNIVINDTNINMTGSEAVEIGDSSHIFIYNIHIENASYSGIHLYSYCDNVSVIASSIFSFSGHAILSEYTNNVLFKDNIFQEVEYGLFVSNADNVSIVGNTIYAIINNGIDVESSTNILIKGNTLYSNNGDGIYFNGVTKVDIYYNSIETSYNGIDSCYTQYLTAYNNTITQNNNYGIYFGDMAYDSIVYFNDFENNNGGSIQAYDGGSNNTWYNWTLSLGNYWSDWDASVDYYSIDGPANSRDLYPLGGSSSNEDNDAPSIYNFHIEPTEVTSQDNITIFVEVDDPSGIFEVVLYYAVNDQNNWQSIYMMYQSGNTYSVTIGPYNNHDTIYLYVTATDNSSNRNTAYDDNNGNFYIIYISDNNNNDDFDGPYISNPYYSDPLIPNTLIEIFVEAEDLSGVLEVALSFRVGNEPWQKVTMNKVDQQKYSVQIGPFDNDTLVEYYFTATDNSPNHNIATYPGDNSYLSLYIVEYSNNNENQSSTTSSDENTMSLPIDYISTLISLVSVSVTVVVIKRKYLR